jgi:hypothetical protein
MEKQILTVSISLEAPLAMTLLAVGEYVRASVASGGAVLAPGDPAREISEVRLTGVFVAPGEIERLRDGESLR